MKTSPELLSSILQVLTKIEKKMEGGAESSKSSFSDLITGKKSVKDIFKKKSAEEENTIKALSLGVEKLNKELKKVDIEKLDSIYKLLGRSKKLTEISTLFENIAGKDLVTFRNNLGELSQSILSLNSELDKLDVDTLSSIQEQFAKSNINITDFNQLVTNIDFSPLDNIADVVLKLNTAFDTLPIIQAENFRNSLIYLTDSSKKLMTELESLSKVNVDILEKYSQSHILEQSILSDTTLNKFALLKQHIEDSASKLQLMHNNFSKFDEEFIKQLTSAGNKLDDELIGKIKVFNDNINNTLVSLSTIKSNLTNLDISSLESLMSIDINKNSLAGENGIKNLLLLKKNINLLTEDTDTLFKKLSTIKFDIVNEIISKGGNLSLILNDLNTITFNPLNIGISESLDNLSRLNREISNIDILAIKNLSSVSGVEIISEDVIKKIEDFKIKIYQSSENLIAFKDSLKLFDENGLNAISDAGITLNWIFGDLINDNLRNFSKEISNVISDISTLNNKLSTINVAEIDKLNTFGAQLKDTFDKLNDIKEFNAALVKEINPASIFGDLTRDKIAAFKDNVANSSAAILQLNQELQNLSTVPLDKLSEIGGSLNSTISQIDISRIEEFKAQIQSFADSTKHLGAEIKNLDAKPLDNISKSSDKPVNKDSLISMLLGNTSMKQWAMLRLNAGIIKKISENLDALSIGAENLSISLSKINFGEFNAFAELLNKDISDKSVFGNETSKNISAAAEQIKTLYENTEKFNQQLAQIDVNIVDNLVQSVSKPIEEVSIFSSSTSNIVDKFKTNMIKTSNAAEKLMKQFSGSSLKDFKLFLNVLNTKMKTDSLFEFLGDTKKQQEFSINLKTFIESLQKLNKEFKPLESLNLKDLATFKDLIEITGKNFEKNALMSEKKSARIRDNLFLIAEGIAELNKQLEKTDANKLKDLSAGIDKLETPSKKQGFKEKISGFAHAAKETAMAVVYMGLGLVAFGAALVVTSKLLGVSPLGVLGFVLLTSVVMAASMTILATGSAAGDKIGNQLGVTTSEGKGSNTKTAIENAKNMGTALMYIAGGIGAMAISLVATKVLLGANSIGVAVLAIAGTVLAMTGLMYILGATAAITEVGIKASKDMGKAMMYMSGGILAFATTIALVPKILGINKGAKEGEGGALGTKRGWGGAIAGIGSIFLVIAGMVGVFALMGAASGLIATGIATADLMAGAMAFMSLGVLAVAFSSKILLSTFGKGTDKKPDGTDRGVMGKALATMGNVVAGLGAFGLFVLSSVGLLAGLGMPLISVPTLMGAVTLVGVSMALIMTAKSIKKVQEAMEGVDATSLKLNIANMIDAVLNGVIRGITGDPNATVQDNRLDLDRGDIVQFRRVKKVLRIFGHIAGSISKFASGLRAFAKVGEIASLDYDENGNPSIGAEGKIHVTSIAKSIADTFGLFLNSLVNNTQNLTRTQARSLKILSKSLVGKKGLISGVSEFAETINTFSKYGEKGEIYVVNEQTGVGTHVSITTIVKNITGAFSKFVQGLIGKESMFKREGEVGKRMHAFSKTLMGRKGMISAINDFANTLQTFAELGASGKMSFVEYDSKGEPIIDKIKPVTITSIVQNIVSAFSKFASGMGAEASKFNLGGGARNQMDKLSVALMGEKKILGKEKPGLLSGIMAFSELIQKLAGYGADGKIPRLDENGQIIPGSKPIEIDVVTKGIVAAITKFVTSLETQLKDIDVSGADKIDTKLKSFSKVVDTLDKMSKSSDGIDRISTSIGSMAQNVQLLVESMGKLDVGKFESFSTAAATAAKNAPAVTTTSTANSAASQAQAQQLQTQQWNQMADTIGTKIAEKIAAGFLNGEFNFTFYNSTGGKLEISNT